MKILKCSNIQIYTLSIVISLGYRFDCYTALEEGQTQYCFNVYQYYKYGETKRTVKIYINENQIKQTKTVSF